LTLFIFVDDQTKLDFRRGKFMGAAKKHIDPKASLPLEQSTENKANANWFVKINDDEKIFLLLANLALIRRPILIKDMDHKDPVITLLPLMYRDKNLICEVAPQDVKNLPPPKELQEVIFQFHLDNSKYFGVAAFKTVDFKVQLKVVKPLFQLQRRAHFRMPIPDHVTCSFKIEGYSPNAKGPHSKALEFRVKDLSSTGCRLIPPPGVTPNFNQGESLSGSLLLKGQDPQPIQGEIRSSLQKDGSVSYGFQFSSKTAELNRVLNQWLMSLYREHYHRPE
jgi:hypothetical protein